MPGADLEPIAIGEERELTAEERAAREAEEEERAAREAAAAADPDDETIAPRVVTVPADTQIQATGKRKSAVARILVRSGDGAFQINDLSIEEYFKSSQHQALARQPLVTAGYEGSVDIKVRVHGGGISGQAGAVRHGVARALTTLEPELRGDLKKRGMLTRDDRRKERKKAGLKKARKRPQFSQALIWRAGRRQLGVIGPLTAKRAASRSSSLIWRLPTAPDPSLASGSLPRGLPHSSDQRFVILP